MIDVQNNKVFSLKIGGKAGEGIKSSGLLLTKFAGRSGYHVFSYVEFPSIIKGGHNVMQVYVSEEEVVGPSKSINFLIALNQESVDLHVNELLPNSGVLIDTGDKINTEDLPQDATVYEIPLAQIAKDVGGKELYGNVVSLGATVGLCGGDLSIFKNLLTEEFGDKGDEVVQLNHKAAEAGYNFALENFKDKTTDKLKSKQEMSSLVPRMILAGNEAAALGAIAGGVQFACIYPMSPISGILHVLAKHQKEFGYVYKQPEDEISAINMSIGASFAGARSLTATSGGGFCLMAEGYGLAGITEIPVVIIEGMRGSPATGIPTWSEQGDLRFVLHAHQGDFPRIVLAAGDPEETFKLTMKALNLSEKYQTPVVLLIDKNICENNQDFEFFNVGDYKVDRGLLTFEKIENYKRYEITDNGISTRSVPGSGNFFVANSDEHDLEGYSNEEIETRVSQMDKRMKKLVTCEAEDMEAPVLYGPENADITVVSWGSCKGSILQAMKQFTNVNYLHITWMNPFPTEAVKERLQKAKYLINIESNYSAQLGGIIAEKTGIRIQDNFLKYDGRPFFVEELVEKFKKVGGK